MRTPELALLVLLAVVPTAAMAQSSASYRLDEHVFNSGGVPDGSAVNSASFSLSLVAIGQGVGGGDSPSSSSYSVAGGFPSAYPAPGEVTGLVFNDPQTLAWEAEHSAGTYNFYRASLASLAGLGYGSCEQPGLTDSTATDGDEPAASDGYFYLVTVRNRLHEEGTKGFDGGGSERLGNACP